MREKLGNIKTAYEMDYSGSKQVKDHYAEWADNYDTDTNSYGYVGPEQAAAVLAQVVPDKSITVLDIGCGTGLVGEALARQGFSQIDGTDLSPDMIRECAAKNVYRNLRCDDLIEGIDLPEQSHGAVISVGTFGPLGPEHLPNALRQVRSGGFACISVNDLFLEENDFQAAINNICTAGGWELKRQEFVPHLIEGGHKALISVVARL